MKMKTIGPMTLDECDHWGLPFLPLLCDNELRRRFNIPKSAIELWVTLTKSRPKHRDAIRVRFSGRYGVHARLDFGINDDVYILGNMRAEAKGFGSDFYATIYYE